MRSLRSLRSLLPTTRHFADTRSGEVFRPVTGMFVCGVWALLTIFWLVMEARVGTRDLIVRLPAAAAAGLAVALVFWWPRVEVDDEGVTVHNIVRSIRVPFPALESVTTRFCLNLTDRTGKTYGAWAAPAAGRVTVGPGSRSHFPELDAARPTPVLGGRRSDASAVAVAIARHRPGVGYQGPHAVSPAPPAVESAVTVTWARGRLIVLGVCIALAALLPVVL